MKIKQISYRSRASVKIRDSFYTFEYGEDREIEDGDDIIAEREKLENECNLEIDNQIIEIAGALKSGKN